MNEKIITNIKIEKILPNRLQPRIIFQDEQIDELAESIKKYGVINPITVRKLGDKYEIIAGERRFKASKSIGLEEIPAFVIEADDKASAELALIENIQRKDLSPIEEGLSYDKILKISEITQEELSKRLGKKQSTIANKIRLLKLDDSVKDALLNEQISERHARALLKLSDKESQRDLLNKILEERLTVRQTDEEIGKIIEQKGGIIEMNRNFDIPSSTIIEDKNEELVQEPNVINPSFVDVNKIENESKDIFLEKPEVNIEDLLKSLPKEEAIENNVSSEEKVQDVNEIPGMSGEHGMPTPKFFSFFPPEDDEQEINQLPVFEPKKEEKTVSQPEGFDIETIPSSPVPQTDENAMNVSEGFSFDSIETIQDFKVEEKEVMNDSYDLDNLINQKIEQPELEEQELPEMKESKIEEPVVPQYDFQNFNPIIHNDFVEAPDEEELEFIEEEDEITSDPVIDNSPKQMKDVIRVIRDCNDIIESYGYKIETEEFDLETMYQVIFKVFKN